MKTILVDDEPWMLKQFEMECRSLSDIQILGMFDDPTDALEYAKTNLVELAFLDIEMPGMNGIELATKLRELYPTLIVIFVSGYDKYMPEAFKMDADYFVTKPYTQDNVEAVLDRIMLLSRRLRKRIFIKTFGSFEVFVDNKPVKFSSAKAKELLAYLVDRNGSVVNAEEGFSILYEDRNFDPSSGIYRNVVARLQTTLEQNGILEILYILPRGRAINVDAVDCDYFRFLNGDKTTRENWNGEYMSNYSWGEFTLGSLFSQSQFSKE